MSVLAGFISGVKRGICFIPSRTMAACIRASRTSAVEYARSAVGAAVRAVRISSFEDGIKGISG